MEMSLATWMLSVSMCPASSPCTFGENPSSNAFWMITASPNVASSGASPLSSVKLSKPI